MKNKYIIVRKNSTSMTTKHTHPVVFGRKMADCPRCTELLNGAKPVQWRGSQRKQEEARTLERIRNHDFAACAKKHIVCTCFEW